MMQGQQIISQTQNPIYQNLGRALFQGESEKSLVDKLLGRQDADKLHKLMQKEPLTKSDIEEILFLMTSIDQKIVNYDEWDRYVVVKLFPWVKDCSIQCKAWMIYEESFNNGDFDEDFTQILEMEKITEGKIKQGLLEEVPNLEEIEKLSEKRLQKKVNIKKPGPIKPILEETKSIVSQITKYMQHNLKFLISIFNLVSNTTLSIEGAAFETLTTARYEYHYPNMGVGQPPQRSSFLNIFSRKK